MFLMTNQVHIYNTKNLNTFYLFPAQTNMTFWHKISGSQTFQFSKSQYKIIVLLQSLFLNPDLKHFSLADSPLVNNACFLLLFSV